MSVLSKWELTQHLVLRRIFTEHARVGGGSGLAIDDGASSTPQITRSSGLIAPCQPLLDQLQVPAVAESQHDQPDSNQEKPPPAPASTPTSTRYG